MMAVGRATRPKVYSVLSLRNTALGFTQDPRLPPRATQPEDGRHTGGLGGLGWQLRIWFDFGSKLDKN